MTDPRAVHQALCGGDELALIDVREEGVFGRGHILRAVNVPLSILELRFRDLVPRRSTPVVLCDGGDDGLAARAASRLRAMGYTETTVLDGGAPAWAAAGFELFSSINVPSKAFGEVVEHRFDTPRLEPGEVDAARRAGRNVAILDSRPFEEYVVMNIPGGIDIPGAELVHRVKTVVDDPETLVVVNCAGRTRSIIGAQSLINAGLENRVVALKDGTMGWHLAGLGRSPLETGPAAASVPERETVRVERVEPDTLVDMPDAVVVDLAPSLTFRPGHIPGAWWAIRARLADEVGGLAGTGPLVLTSPDGRLAQLAAADLADGTARPVLALAGGTAAWAEAGHPLEDGIERTLSAVEDVFYRPYDRTDGVEEAMNAYLSWEVGLLHQIERDGTLTFPEFPG